MSKYTIQTRETETGRSWRAVATIWAATPHLAARAAVRHVEWVWLTAGKLIEAKAARVSPR